MATELIPQIVYGAVLLFVLGAIGALWYRMGGIQRDVGRLEANVGTLQTSLTEKTAHLHSEINEKFGNYPYKYPTPILSPTANRQSEH